MRQWLDGGNVFRGRLQRIVDNELLIPCVVLSQGDITASQPVHADVNLTKTVVRPWMDEGWMGPSGPQGKESLGLYGGEASSLLRSTDLVFEQSCL